ncbi:hypothetical protein NQ317_005718 [Molorchus minor]|uniref:Uncharacterized protein n=1 Tax=Molorchus minor TaxID=1323400 RepID=A0ABQ9IVJ0_9CUCU|nr:hypothetical protein NQ317_005718 [Molorchus minor]
MKMIIALSALVAIAVAAPQGQFAKDNDANAVVVKYDSDNIGIDGYNFAFETSNGISGQEAAQLNNPGTDNENLAVRGSYSYTGDDGQVYTVNYLADENGFQPIGKHLPVQP